MRWNAIWSTGVQSVDAWKSVGGEGERAGGSGSMPAVVRKFLR